MSQPLLSIVIPTKDRYKYLKLLLQSIYEINSKEIEVVLQDNTLENTEILEFLSLYNYPRIKYSHTPEQIPISLNCDKAILKSSGKYVCFIGDDDGILPSIIETTKFAEINKIDAYISKIVKYNWPDYVDNSRYKLSAVVMDEISTVKEGYLNPTKELKKVVKDGFCTLGLLPKVYQGVVTRQCLDRIYENFGTYFPGPSPDMANAVALALLKPKFYYFNKAIIITGQCRSVGGGEKLLNGILLDIKDVPHLFAGGQVVWDEKIPTVWCAETVWPVSGIMVIKRAVEKPAINYDLVYARFATYHPSYKNLLCEYKINHPSISFYKLKVRVLSIWVGILTKFSFTISNGKRIRNHNLYRNVRDICEISKLF